MIFNTIKKGYFKKIKEKKNKLDNEIFSAIQEKCIHQVISEIISDDERAKTDEYVKKQISRIKHLIMWKTAQE